MRATTVHSIMIIAAAPRSGWVSPSLYTTQSLVVERQRSSIVVTLRETRICTRRASIFSCRHHRVQGWICVLRQLKAKGYSWGARVVELLDLNVRPSSVQPPPVTGSTAPGHQQRAMCGGSSVVRRRCCPVHSVKIEGPFNMACIAIRHPHASETCKHSCHAQTSFQLCGKEKTRLLPATRAFPSTAPDE